MIDRIFSAALTFCLLAGGTLAIGSAMFGMDQRSAAPRPAPTGVKVVQLERVVIVARRPVPAATVARTDSTGPATQRAE